MTELKDSQGQPSGPLVDAAIVSTPRPRSPRRDRWFGPKLRMLIGALPFIWLIGWALAAGFANWLPLADPSVDVGKARMLPFTSWGEIAGTDAFGRSVLSRLVFGARSSLTLSLMAATVGMIVGTTLGLAAGYLRGWVDAAISTLTDSMLAFPGMVLLLSLGAIFGQGTMTLTIGLAAVSTPTFIRVSRATTLQYAGREFVEASKLAGARPARIMRREILPNVIPATLAYAVVVIAYLIMVESALSFLGLGIQPPNASWGSMIADTQSYLTTDAHMLIAPVLTLILTILALNAAGERLNKRMDVRRAAV